MRIGKLIAAAATAALATATAQAMPAATFLAKADGLMAKGPLALFSSDVGLLKTEGAHAAAELKAERLALVAQHKPTAYCPPVKSAISSDELIKSLRRFPPADLAKMQFKDAFRQVLAQKYPCPR